MTHLNRDSKLSDSATDTNNNKSNKSGKSDCNNKNNSPSNKDITTATDLSINSDFSLDMVSSDMDFEQAYTMYSGLQQKHALSAVEQLQKVQMLNQQFITNLEVPNNFPGNTSFSFDNRHDDKFEYHRSQILSGGLMDNSTNKSYSFLPENQNIDNENDDEFDQFFSNTESNALEKFLDNLANPTNTDPLQFYNNYNPRNIHNHSGFNDINNLFDLHTMKPSINSPIQNNQVRHENENLKQELTEAFSHPPLKSVSSSSSSSPPQDQLPTPVDSRQSSSFIINNPLNQDSLVDHNANETNNNEKKRELDYPTSSSPPASPKKRRRSSNKPLLSSEQKRLNHSHSEQKRRQLCKLAYERCVKLIVNMDEYNKEMSNNKKSKRAKINKDGLPNLSKHTALIKISNEIMKIKIKNEKLKKLINESVV